MQGEHLECTVKVSGNLWLTYLFEAVKEVLLWLISPLRAIIEAWWIDYGGQFFVSQAYFKKFLVLFLLSCL